MKQVSNTIKREKMEKRMLEGDTRRNVFRKLWGNAYNKVKILSQLLSHLNTFPVLSEMIILQKEKERERRVGGSEKAARKILACMNKAARKFTLSAFV